MRFVDPAGQVHGPLTTVPSPGGAYADLDLSALPRRDGIGALEWGTGEREEVALGLLGSEPTLLRAILDLGRRLGTVWEGTAESGNTEVLVDPDLVVGGSARGRYLLVLHPPHLMGSFRRVREHEGQVLFVDQPFPASLEGARYALLDYAPDLLEQALRLAYRSLFHTARVEVVYVVEVDPEEWDRTIVLPQGWEAVFQVWAGDLSLPPQFWSPLPGRRLVVYDRPRLPEIRSLTIRGFRSGFFPTRVESIVEGDVQALVAQASGVIFLSGSGGAAIDPEERLRKALLAFQESEASRRSRRGRIPVNARPILE